MAFDDWTDEEVELTVTDYFLMLKAELAEVSYNKSSHRKALLPLLGGALCGGHRIQASKH
jgi:hypothetical protein